MPDFGVGELVLGGAAGAVGSWSSVEKEARDGCWRRDEWRDAITAKLSGERRSSDRVD